MDRPVVLKELFGNKSKLDIWGTVLAQQIEPPTFFTGQEIFQSLADNQLRIARPEVYGELARLETLGMIEKTSREALKDTAHPHLSSATAIFYRRLESPGWKIVECSVEAIAAWFPASSPGTHLPPAE